MTQAQTGSGMGFGALGGNPYPLFEQLRKNMPVTRMGDGGFWAVSRHEDVVRILRDPETFSSIVSAKAIAGDVQPSMLFNDPPMHTRLRSLIAKAFTPRVVEQQRPAITEYCERLVGAMCAKDEADLVLELAYPLPVMVIANMLGVADGDLATFKRWSDEIIENLGPVMISGDDSGMAATNAEFNAYFEERLEKLRHEPEDNLLTELVNVETEEGRLTQDELLMFCRLLLVAGNETTTGLIVNAVRAFAEFPEVYDRVRREPGLVASATEEALRYYAPFPATIRRTSRDVEVAGTTIPAGQRLLVLLGSANRDETVFERPNEFIPDRSPNRHVAFGMGIHYCVGAPLARLEGEIAVRALAARVSRFHIGEVDPGALMRPGGPKSLMVRFAR
ncbi:MAG: cytochrome P450 [Dehalococcoidia bacterium]